jgi:hypothetical protein
MPQESGNIIKQLYNVLLKSFRVFSLQAIFSLKTGLACTAPVFLISEDLRHALGNFNKMEEQRWILG